ncbi:hypothetical protein [Photobacterium sp. DNB22_13_2]
MLTNNAGTIVRNNFFFIMTPITRRLYPVDCAAIIQHIAVPFDELEKFKPALDKPTHTAKYELLKPMVINIESNNNVAIKELKIKEIKMKKYLPVIVIFSCYLVFFFGLVTRISAL